MRSPALLGLRVSCSSAVVSLSLSVVCLAAPARAGEEVLELLIGEWDVRLKTLHPKRPDIVYRETHEWVLDRKFVRGRTSGRPDGTEDVMLSSYDTRFKNYPLWWFTSSNRYLSHYGFAFANWDADTRTLTWKNPPNWPIHFDGRAVFNDDGTRSWSVKMTRWTGTVLLGER